MNLRQSLRTMCASIVFTSGLGIAVTACSSDSQSSGSDGTVTGGSTMTTAQGGSSAITSNGGTTAATVNGTGTSAGGQTGVGGSSTGGSSDASGGTTSTTASGGKGSFGGTTATGGKSGAGGKSSTGGTTASGGKTSTGGATASGGKTSTGGTTASGGKTSTGGTTTTGGTNSTGYCPATEPCRISPLGDSITEGMGWTPPGATGESGGYRVKLFSLANADGKNFTFVGTRSNGPTTVDGKTFPKSHEGTSGISIENLQKDVVEKGALTGSAVKPHIILLHIGTNNMYNSHPAKPEVLIEPLLDRIIKDCPDALLVVAKIIPYSGVDSFNAALPAIVEKRAKAGAHIILVDQNTGFPSTELKDGVHPNEAGYTRMANVWYKAISSYLH